MHIVPFVFCKIDDRVALKLRNLRELRGGAALLGKSLLLCHNAKSCDMIRKLVAWFSESHDHFSILESYGEKENKNFYMITLRDNAGNFIGYYEKHEYRTDETMKLYDFA